MANFNLNQVIIGGRLTADPELKQTQQGTSTTRFSVAVNRRGSKEPVTDFINCVAWRQNAEFICKYFKKGASICIRGSIQTSTWNDQQNNKRYVTEVMVDEAFFVDSKAENPVAPSYTGDVAPSFQTQQEPKFETISGDDDLPF